MDEYDAVHDALKQEADIETYAANLQVAQGMKSVKEKSKIHFLAVCDGKILMDINLGYDHHSIINLANVVKQHFINSDATEVIITVKKEN